MPKLLIVDDEELFRNSMAQMLRDEGYDVCMAADGKAALAELRAMPQKPGLILFDLAMPGMNGGVFRNELLKDPDLAGIPVVLLSGDEAAREHAFLLRTSGFLCKPVDVRRLLDIV